MIPLTPAEIATATRGSLAGVDGGDARGLVGVSVDSRAVENGDLFVAIAGERVDGHDYAAEAVAAGARCILSARPLHAEDGTPLPCVVVDDPTLALGALAAWYRRERLTCTVVGITGSSGKTSTKDLVARVLSAGAPTVSAKGSFNSEVGLPLTVLRAARPRPSSCLDRHPQRGRCVRTADGRHDDGACGHIRRVGVSGHPRDRRPTR